MATLAEQLIEILRQQGVTRVYGVAGDSLKPVVDAIRRAGGIDWVHVRDEEAGAFAAAAEAQLTGSSPSNVRLHGELGRAPRDPRRRL
jgi:pyruvate dehydrogenase (quinone)